MAIDWTASMQQTFEFYKVDPDTWSNTEKLGQVISAQVTWDDSNETLGSASIETTEIMDECYIRIYLICIQNGVRYEFPIGTFMVQTPEESHNSGLVKVTMDAYTPLLELKDNVPPYGYTAMRGWNTLTTVSDLVSENCRAPVVRVSSNASTYDSTDTYSVGERAIYNGVEYECLSDILVAEEWNSEHWVQIDKTIEVDTVSDFGNDSWLSFLTGLLATAELKFGLDEMGRILFRANQNDAAVRPIWTYDDGNSSILYPDVRVTRDLYGVPNVVEVLYSNEAGAVFSRVENNDVDSPVSIPRRGRLVVHRENNPDSLSNPSQEQLDNYAENLLRDLSSLEYTISYTHGYCPVRVGDAVWINYERAGLTDIKAVVISQQITCRPGCSVSETAKFTKKLWR